MRLKAIMDGWTEMQHTECKIRKRRGVEGAKVSTGLLHGCTTQTTALNSPCLRLRSHPLLKSVRTRVEVFENSESVFLRRMPVCQHATGAKIVRCQSTTHLSVTIVGKASEPQPRPAQSFSVATRSVSPDITTFRQDFEAQEIS